MLCVISNTDFIATTVVPCSVNNMEMIHLPLLCLMVMLALGTASYPPLSDEEILRRWMECAQQRSELLKVSYDAIKGNLSLRNKVKELSESLTKIYKAQDELLKDCTSGLQEHLQVLDSHRKLSKEYEKLQDRHNRMKHRFISRLKNKRNRKTRVSEKKLAKCHENLKHANETMKNMNTAFEEKVEKAEMDYENFKKFD